MNTTTRPDFTVFFDTDCWIIRLVTLACRTWACKNLDLDADLWRGHCVSVQRDELVRVLSDLSAFGFRGEII